MEKELNKILLRKINKSTSLRKDKKLLKDALNKIDEIASAQDELQNNIKPEYLIKISKTSSRNEIKEALNFIKNLYNSGGLSYQEYILCSVFNIERIHDDRMSNGYYSIIAKMENELNEIEKQHGLKDDEYWHINDSPIEYQEIIKEYDSQSKIIFHQTLIEFELFEIAKLYIENIVEYKKIRELGRRSIFHKDDIFHALKELIYKYEKDAISASNIGAHSAAITSLGSAMEGLLLLRCLRAKTKSIKIAKNLPKKHKPRYPDDPTTWSFDNFIEVCKSAGWLKNIKSDAAFYDASKLAHFLRFMRNYIHPGKIIRENPWNEICEDDYKKARSIYIVLHKCLSGKTNDDY